VSASQLEWHCSVVPRCAWPNKETISEKQLTTVVSLLTLRMVGSAREDAGAALLLAKHLEFGVTGNRTLATLNGYDVLDSSPCCSSTQSQGRVSHKSLEGR